MRACLHAREHACLLVFVRVCVGALSSQPNLPAGLMAPHWLQPLPSTGDCTASTLPGGEASSNGFHPDFRSGCSGVAGCWVWAAGARSAKRSSRSMLDVAARVGWSSCPVTPKRSSSASPGAAIVWSTALKKIFRWSTQGANWAKTANLMATTISKLRQMMQGTLEVRPGVELIKYVMGLTAHDPK